MRRALCSLLTVVVVFAGPAHARARMDRRTYALSLIQEGRRHLARGGVDQRRAALNLFEDAALVAPKEPAVLVVLGDAYVDAGYLHRARTAFEHAVAIAPADPDARFGFARIHRREWLESGWESDLQAAIDEAREAVRLRPDFGAAWTALVALDVELGDLPQAREAAEHALASDSLRTDAQLAAAEMAYRTGEIARADSLFRIALARLDPAVAAHFADVAPLLAVRDADALEHAAPAARARYAERFWSANDPDPVTPQNEARLEYWSRQSHALLLLGDPWSPIWRERTAVYVRYGRHVQVDDPMRSRHYEMARLDLGEVAVAPTPAQLEHIHQLTASEGQSAFSPLPPGAQPLPLAARVTRFEGSSGASLLAQIEVQGAPGDSLDGECVVLDGDDRLVARATSPLSASACDPGERAGEFTFTVPPGSYRLAFAVHDGRNRRGLSRVSCDVADPGIELAMSELAPNCGPPALAVGREDVRLNPNPRAWFVGRDPLVAYFEIYRLHTNDRGLSRFQYEYRVQELGAPGVPWYRQPYYGRGAADGLAFQTSQQGVGSTRRQLIQVPTRVLPAGRYEIEVTVTDLIGGRVVRETMPFSRLWSEEELSGEPVPAAGPR